MLTEPNREEGILSRKRYLHFFFFLTRISFPTQLFILRPFPELKTEAKALGLGGWNNVPPRGAVKIGCFGTFTAHFLTFLNVQTALIFGSSDEPSEDT